MWGWRVGAIAVITGVSGSALGEVALRIDPSTEIGRIDERVYGQFLEHIYHSANGGLWGELVWNRSFEESLGAGLWQARNGGFAQLDLSPNVRWVFGEPTWRDYEYTLSARKLGGHEGFLVLFRVAGPDDFYWMNLGGWNNTRHALERGRHGEGRWGVIREAGAGAIETGRWYQIRVRCEGTRLQVWLDDQRLLDFTDDAKGHLAGAVGVGTWATSAEYRDLKVVALDGRILLDRPPSLPGGGLPRHWSVYGGANGALDPDQPLNSRLCLRLEAPAGGGIEQRPLSVRAGETYRGSLWARGAAADGLVVRLTDGSRVLAGASLPPPSDDWREFPVVLRPTGAAAAATLQVGLPGGGRVWLDQVSLMPDSWRRAGGFRPDLLAAVAALRPPVIRWPGGCYAEHYRWQDGIGPQHWRGRFPLAMWDDIDPNSLGTDEFIDLCRRVGAEPLLVVNIGRHDARTPRAQYIREACEWIEYCNGPPDSPWGRVRAANGHREPYGVRLWEIDNETWGMGPEAYAAAVREFVPAMRQADPSIRILACGSAGFGLDWNRAILDHCADVIDYLSIHHYENPDRFADGPRAYERFFAATGELIAASANPAIRLFVSEWNAQSTDWRTGLYAAGLLNAFERSAAVGMASPALFLRHVSATEWDNALINFDHRGWFGAPNYVVMRLWRESYGPRRLGVEGDPAALNVSASGSDDGGEVYLKLVNPSADAVDVALTMAGAIEMAALRIIAPGDLAARNTLEDPQRVRPSDAPVAIDGARLRFTMPALSAGVLRVRRPAGP